jgi:hypothetical protein
MAKYNYELRSINYWTLSPEEQRRVRRGFTSFLNSLTEPVSFRVLSDVREVDVGGDIWDNPYKRFFIESDASLEPAISYLGAKSVRVPSVPSVEVRTVLPLMMVDSESNFVQAFNVTNLSGSLYIGFLASLYDIAHEVRVDLQPVDQYEAGKTARGHYISVGTNRWIRESEGRAPLEEEELEYARSKLASELIAAGRERLFRLRFDVVLRAKSIGELREKRKRMNQILSGLLMCQVDHPKYLQRPLFTGKGPGWATGRWFYATGSTAMLFFPFAGLDIVDPMGVVVGQNGQTGAYIVYDFYDKENYNVSILGSTGSGKSTQIKSMISRLLFRNQDMMLYVFDAIVKPEYSVGPDGTYENSFAGITKCEVHHYRRDEGAGLDPYSVFPEKRMATDFIASLTKLDEDPELYAELAVLEKDAVSVSDLLQRIQALLAPASVDLTRERKDTLAKLLTRLRANLDPYLFLFAGEMRIYDRMVFVLHDIPDEKTRDAAAFLTLSAVWQQIRKMPAERKKALVLDEAWAFMQKDPSTGKMYFPLAVKYIPDIARTGRRHNLLFVVATQLVSDFFGVGDREGPGREVVELCVTKYLLRQDQKSAADTLMDKFALSEDERDVILNARPGDGILVTGEGRIPFHNRLGSQEEKLFSTAPKDVKS